MVKGVNTPVRSPASPAEQGASSSRVRMVESQPSASIETASALRRRMPAIPGGESGETARPPRRQLADLLASAAGTSRGSARELLHGDVTQPGRGAEAPVPTSTSGPFVTSSARGVVNARDVYRLLTTEHGKSVSELGLPSWAAGYRNPSQWIAKALDRRLSKTPDYPEWRDRLQRLVVEQGLFSGQLPDPPAKLRDKISASRLAEILGQILQRQATTADQGGPDLRGAAMTNTVRSWLRADGGPKKPLKAYACLPDAQEVGSQLAQLWASLGHTDAAKGLRDEMQAAAQAPRWDARAVADALRLLAADPTRSWASLAIELGISTRTLTTDVNRDGSLNRPGHLPSLPGYALQIESIRASLRALNHAEQAEALPEPPRMLVNQLLNQGHEQTQPLIGAARLLRADPSMTMAAAARAMKAPMSLLEMLLDDRGEVRTRQDIARHLSGLDPGSTLRLDRWLAGLDAKVREAGSVATAAESSLKALHLGKPRLGADRVLVVDAKTIDPGATAPRRLETIYAQNPDLIRRPRSFDADRLRQPLRWLSTLLQQQFQLGTEIQCYYEPQQRNIIVSSNVSGINDQLESFLKSGGLEPFLSDSGRPEATTAPTERQQRHMQKLATRMDPASDPHPGTPAEDILAAIAERRFAVPIRNYRSEGNAVELHAERRIADHLASESLAPLDTSRLAGTMRPCGVCADEIGAGPEVHRGPVWLSRAATVGVDTDDLLARNLREGAATSVSRTRDGRVTFDHDTDSDSDLDGATARRAAGVLGKRKADDSHIGEPGTSSASQVAARADSPPRLQSVAPPSDDVMGELTRHLDTSNWP